MPWTKEDYAYLAGFLDGEGCIGVYSRIKQNRGSRQYTPSKSYRPRVSIVNTNKEVLEWIKKEFGGYLSMKTKVAGHKIGYSLNIVDYKKIERMIINCLPNLKVKKEVALLVLKFPWNAKCNQYTREVTKQICDFKEQLYLETLKLNKRGDGNAVESCRR